MRVTLPDSVVDLYQAYADQSGKSLDSVIADRLKRTAVVPHGSRMVFVGGDPLDRLEAKLGGGSITTADDLARRVERLAGITFMGKDLQLSPNQLEELAQRAERQGKSIDDLITDIWAHLRDNFFYTSGGGEAVVTAPPAA